MKDIDCHGTLVPLNISAMNELNECHGTFVPRRVSFVCELIINHKAFIFNIALSFIMNKSFNSCLTLFLPQEFKLPLTCTN